MLLNARTLLVMDGDWRKALSVLGRIALVDEIARRPKAAASAEVGVESFMVWRSFKDGRLKPSIQCDMVGRGVDGPKYCKAVRQEFNGA